MGSYLDDQAGRIHHPHDQREEFRSNMWGGVKGRRAEYIEKAIQFTGNAALFGAWMIRVLDAWPISCEHSLSFRGHNRRAWIGQAACALAIDCPEDIVREAWSLLTDRQRRDANRMADRAIAEWERRGIMQGGLFDA